MAKDKNLPADQQNVPKKTMTGDPTDNPQLDPDNEANDPTGDDQEANDADGNGGYPDEMAILKDKPKP